MKEYSRLAHEKLKRFELKHGLNTPFKAYSWNKEQTDVCEITAYISLAPSGRCDCFYIDGEPKDVSVICESREEVFAKLLAWQQGKLERAQREHVLEFEALLRLQSKIQVEV